MRTRRHVSASMCFFHVEAQYKKKSQSGTRVGIFPTLADPILDRPEWGKFLLWAVDFSRLAGKKSHLRSRFLEPLPEWDGPRVVRYPK